MMPARNGSRIFLALVIVGLTGAATGIQNDRTYTRPARKDDFVLSASVYTGPEKTSSLYDVGSLAFEKTRPAYQLESSKSQTNRYDSSYDNHDTLSSSKHDGVLEQIDGNNIEFKTADYSRRLTVTRIEPTQTGEEEGAPQGRNLLSEPRRPPSNGISSQQVHEHQQLLQQQQQRQARQENQRIYSEHAPPPVLQTASLGHRQANPDIQDIITGIVKLLNGNVNVAANTVRPLRPIQATRINNRGPPRISDVPPLPPDFDTPGMNPPPPPPHRPGGTSTPDRPYPFEKPPAPERPLINQLPPERPVRPFLNGVPLPEQIVPQTQENRPWPWNGRPAAGGNRRPITSYKPFPQSSLDSGVHREKDQHLSEKPQFDVKRKPDQQTNEPSKKTETAETEDTPSNSSGIGSNSAATTTTTTSVDAASTSITTIDENSADNGHNLSKATEEPSVETATKKSEFDDSGKKGPQKPGSKDKTSSQDTLILGVPSSSNGGRPNNTIFSKKTRPDESKATSTSNQSKNNNEKSVKPSVSRTAQIKPFSTSTLSIETSSSVQVIEPTSTKMADQTSLTQDHDRSTPVPLNTGTFVLEPSRAAYEEIETTERSDSPTDTLPQKTTRRTTTVQPGTIRPTISNSKNTGPATDRYGYRPRPGIVLDDTLDYPGAQGLATQWPYIPTRHPSIGDIFDVTVSAVQGPGGTSGEGVRVPVNVGAAGSDVILTSAVEGQGFVSIDGKRTYLNLFDNTDRSSSSSSSTVQPHPTRTAQTPAIVGTGFAVPQPDQLGPSPSPGRPSGGLPGTGNAARRPIFNRRPTQPPVRIDTCIVGDTSTCDASQHEACATVQGVSACHCKPGYARLQHSLPCKRIVSIVVSMRVDRIYDRRIVWDRGLEEKDSESYQTLAYEANRAIESAMSMTPFSDEYMGSSVNGVYQGDISQGQGGVFVNATLKLTYEPRTVRPSLAGELQRHLLGVIHRRNNNIGNSALYVDSPPGSISNLQDLDECASSELNDCHSSASCVNTWGGFVCTCNQGLKDPHKDDPNESGRSCVSCPSTYCNNRGTCSYQADQMQCTCTGNYYGAQCEVDGEVLGVAIGASVAALIIIVLTLVCLVMWSRRWSREQKSVGSPVYGYIQGGVPGTLPGTLARVGSVGTLASVKQGPPPTNIPPYLWPHFTDHLATANVYATEPMGPTRPSSAMFGYPPLNVHGTLPPVPLPRLQAPPRPRQRHQPDPDSSDSEMQDKDRADLIPQNTGFHVPRPKSRLSLANQSGIYNDVEYDQGDVHHLSKNNIPMSTYRPYYRT